MSKYVWTVVNNSIFIGSVTRTFFIPANHTKYRILAVAGGGAGGSSTAAVGSAGGGGGGAGNYMDEIIDLQPNSIVQATVDTGNNLIINWLPRSLSVYTGTAYRSITLYSGRNGSNGSTVASGVGGDSGAGGEGGTATTVETRIGTGMVDANSLIHTSGGQCGWSSGAPTTLGIDYCYSRSSTGALQRYKNKFSNGASYYAGKGGAGGCSYLGGANKVRAGFGAGGFGADGGVSPVPPAQFGGDVYFSLIWGDEL